MYGCRGIWMAAAGVGVGGRGGGVGVYGWRL